MPRTEIDVDVDVADAVAVIEAIADEVDAAGAEIVDQLVLLAEGAMKDEAPEGAGIPDVHMRDTIKATGRRTRQVVKPRKRTEEGWLLHRAIVGSPSVPTWTPESKPPVWQGPDGEARGPLAEWADAKLGDRSAAWAVQQSLVQSGPETLPNRFIDRSVREWQGQVDRVADRVLEGGI
jgi:hypothetical protein